MVLNRNSYICRRYLLCNIYKPDIDEFQTFSNCQTWRKDVWLEMCSIVLPNLRDVRILKSYSRRCYGSYKYNEDNIFFFN